MVPSGSADAEQDVLPGDELADGGVIGELAGQLEAPAPDGLAYVGHVGTGFTDAALRKLQRRLGSLATPTSPYDGVFSAGSPAIPGR